MSVLRVALSGTLLALALAGEAWAATPEPPDEDDDEVIIEGEDDPAPEPKKAAPPGDGEDDDEVVIEDEDDAESKSDDIVVDNGNGDEPSNGGQASLARTDFYGTFETKAALDLLWEGKQEDVFELRNRLNLRLEWEPHPFMKIVVEGRFTHWLLVEDWPDRGSDDARRETHRGILDAELRDIYGLWRFDFGLDLAVGQRTFSWGRTNVTQPLNVLNPVDFRDGPLGNLSNPLIPVFSVEASQKIGPLTLAVVWIPFFVPHKFDLFGTDWAALSTDLNMPIPETFEALFDAIDPTRYEEFQGILQETQDPPQDGFTGSDVGVRLTTNVEGVDLGMAYVMQWDKVPVYEYNHDEFIPALLGLISGDTASTQAVRENFSSRHERRHVIGGDFAFTVGPVSFAGDFAYSFERTFYTEDMKPLRRPSLLWAVQVDVLYDVIFDFALEFSHLAVFDVPEHTQLALIDEHHLSLNAIAHVRYDLFQLEIIALWGMSVMDLMLAPRLSWRITDEFTVDAGLAIFLGDSDIRKGLGWVYDKADNVYLNTTFTF